jgi:hypothetical protein
MVLRDVGSGFGALVPYSGIDFAESEGLVAASLVAAPKIRFSATLDGFVGQATVGVGFPTGSTQSSPTANGIFSTSILTGLDDYTPVAYVVTEATDAAGGYSRTRALLNASTNTAALQVLPQDLHIRDPHASTSLTAPPQIGLFDAIDTTFVETTINGTLATGLLGLYDIQLDQVSGSTRVRGWRLLAEDINGGVTPTPTLRQYQLPEAGTGATLAVGAWEVTSNARLFRPRTGAVGDLVLGEASHGEITLTRAPKFTITVQ